MRGGNNGPLSRLTGKTDEDTALPKHRERNFRKTAHGDEEVRTLKPASHWYAWGTDPGGTVLMEREVMEPLHSMQGDGMGSTGRRPY